MKNIILFFVLLSVSFYAFSKSKKINYKYKKYERFDFEALTVEGNNSNPGDLSIGPRFKKKFKNKIPSRKNFNPEMIRNLNSIL